MFLCLEQNVTERTQWKSISNTTARGVDWDEVVSETLRNVGMAYDTPDIHKKAFEASHTIVFVYHQGRLIGFGRAISDGVYQGAIYDVAVVPEFQRRGIGTIILKKDLGAAPRMQCHFIRGGRQGCLLSNAGVPEDENGHGALQASENHEGKGLYGMTRPCPFENIALSNQWFNVYIEFTVLSGHPPA